VPFLFLLNCWFFELLILLYSLPVVAELWLITDSVLRQLLGIKSGLLAEVEK